MNADGTYRYVSDTGYTYNSQDECKKLVIENAKKISWLQKIKGDAISMSLS